MYNNPKFGSYVNSNSFYHDLNSVTKVLLTIFNLILVFLVNDFFKLLFLLLLLIIIVVSSKLSLKVIISSIWYTKYFILFTFLLNLLLKVAFIDAFCLVLKIIIILINSFILTMTTRILEITSVFNKLFLPLKKFKLNVNSWSLVFSLSLCLVPIIFNNARKIINSQVARGLNLVDSRILRIKSILIPVFVSSFRKSNSISNYLELSFFSDSVKRTNYKIVKWTIKDISVIIIYIIMFIIIVEVKV